MAKPTIVALGFGLFLTGCMTDAAQQASVEPVALPPVVPRAQAARLIIEQRSRLWKDPMSLREARLGDTMICPEANLRYLPAKPGSTCVCVEANAKNGYGGYTGLRRSVMIFPPSGGLETADAGTDGFTVICGANLISFPELNGDAAAPPKGKRSS